MIINKNKVKAVHDDDMEKLLDKLGILERVKNKELKCKFCNEVIEIPHIHSLFPESGSIKVVCNGTDCILKLAIYIREGKTGS